MRISGAEFERIVAIAQAPKAQGASSPEPQKAVPKIDRADFSAQAQEIAGVKRLLDETPDVREERVKELSEKIASGAYKVSNDEIAEMMLRRNTADRVE